MSEHFTRAELCRSDKAKALRIDNTPTDPQVLADLDRLAVLLEAVRALLGCPLIITSGYRCPALNKAVGGTPTSQHARGQAADFVTQPFDARTAVERIVAADLPYDQVIEEHSGEKHWVHISVPPEGRVARNQALVIRDGVTTLFPAPGDVRHA